jgi:hypothetical protein
LKKGEKKIAEMTKNAPPAKVDPSQMKNATTILPDGSEFWAILDAKGVTETRVFKNHPPTGQNSSVHGWKKCNSQSLYERQKSYFSLKR